MDGVLENHFQTLEDYIFVEDKIVTYKWLSKALKIHINTAKQILHAFTLKEDLKRKLLVTYIIGGEDKNDSDLKFYLLKKDEIDKVVNSLKSVICYHVFSVQRESIFDIATLYNADTSYELNEEDKKFCPILKNEDIVKRNIEKVSLSSGTASATYSDKQKKNESSSKPNKTVETNKKTKLVDTESVLPKSSDENVPPSKSNVSPENQSVKSSPSKGAAQKNKKQNQKNATTALKGQSIGTFFSKQAVNAANKKKEIALPKISTEEKKDSKVIIEKENSESQVQQNNEEFKENKETSSNKMELLKKTPSRKQPSKKRKKRDKDSDKVNKKRKRIKIASDSESSSGDSEMEVEVEVEREPSPEPVKVPLQDSDEEIIPPTPTEKARKRVRKQIDKLYTDEDGFIVTEKESKYVTCSDDEMPIEKKSKVEEMKNNETESTDDKKSTVNSYQLDNDKKSKKKSPARKSPKKKPLTKKSPVKNKQRTIMNFFQRK